MPAYNDLPPGVPAYAAGAAPIVQVPTVAALRATGMPAVQVFQPAPMTPPPQGAAVMPKTLLDRALDISARATSGLRDMLGLPPAKDVITPAATAAAPATPVGTATLEAGLDALEKRSSPTIMQQRAAGAQPVKY